MINPLRKEKLVIFEGIDHVSKSIICEAVYKLLNQKKLPCSSYSFPGKVEGTLGKLVYDIHHNREALKSEDIDPLSLQVLHIAAHIDTLKRNIIPDVSAGKIVLLDRSWWSTFAYGVANGLSAQSLTEIIQPERNLLTQIPRIMFIYISRQKREDDYPIDKTLRILQTYEMLCDGTANTIKIKNDTEIECAVENVYKAIIQIEDNNEFVCK